MLLFKSRFHSGLVDGSITLTFRRWSNSRVKPGGRYRCHPIGVLDVDAVDRVPVGSISEDDALQAGFASREELVAWLQEASEAPIGPETEVFRVSLRYGGDGDRVPAALDTDLGDPELREIESRLRKLDTSSLCGPWTRETLRLISEKPRTAASQLARELNREKAAFKADVVKLKKLGLTQSFEIGYEISPRGRVFLERSGYLESGSDPKPAC